MLKRKRLIKNNFLINFNMVNMVKEPTCYKKTIQPSFIDLIITNKSNYLFIYYLLILTVINRNKLNMELWISYDYNKFEKITMNTLEKHVLNKKKYIRANRTAYVTRPIKKAINKFI